MSSGRQLVTLPDPGSQSFANSTPVLLGALGVALAIRIYLSLTSYCMSGDGTAYLMMARQFSAGEWRAGLSSVFSPLYPLLISATHICVPDWETAGNLVSTIFGTLAVATVYLMTWQVFGRREIALGAAILMAIHPDMAAYSASVRTEAGYAFLTTGTCWLLLKAFDDRRTVIAASAGISGGLAYLYRTEGIGFLVLGILLFGAARLTQRETSRTWALAAGSVFAAMFTLVAAPYLGYLRISTGHWTVGREFNAAMMYGMADVAHNADEWRRLGYSSAASPLAAILTHPALYAEKVGQYFIASLYNFAQGLQPALLLFLGLGLWARGRVAGNGFKELFLAAVVLFYFFGFVLSYTGTRFMIHLVPFTLGWIAAGIIVASQTLARWFGPNHTTAAHLAVPAALALLLLPRTLWPIGYDMRGIRYAGEDIAKIARQRAQQQVAVATRDGRVAYYAGARLVVLPAGPVDVCQWLGSRQAINYVVIGNRDEQALNVTRALGCLELLKRYPHDRSGYYDLFAVRPVATPSLASGPAGDSGAHR